MRPSSTAPAMWGHRGGMLTEMRLLPGRRWIAPAALGYSLTILPESKPFKVLRVSTISLACFTREASSNVLSPLTITTQSAAAATALRFHLERAPIQSQRAHVRIAIAYQRASLLEQQQQIQRGRLPNVIDIAFMGHAQRQNELIGLQSSTAAP